MEIISMEMYEIDNKNLDKYEILENKQVLRQSIMLEAN